MKHRPDSVTEQEWQREQLVRKHAWCPTCEARASQPCSGGQTVDGRRKVQMMSHGTRYNKAAAKGVVPALPGARVG